MQHILDFCYDSLLLLSIHFSFSPDGEAHHAGIITTKSLCFDTSLLLLIPYFSLGRSPTVAVSEREVAICTWTLEACTWKWHMPCLFPVHWLKQVTDCIKLSGNEEEPGKMMTRILMNIPRNCFNKSSPVSSWHIGTPFLLRDQRQEFLRFKLMRAGFGKIWGLKLGYGSSV